MTGRRSNWELTPRELEVLQCAAEGLDGIETGRKLFVTLQTVKFHRTNIFQKLNAKNITHAVAIAFRRGILS